MGVMERVIPLHFTTERTSRGLAIGDPLAAKPPGRLPARAPQFNPDPFGRTRAHTGTPSISLLLLGWPDICPESNGCIGRPNTGDCN